MYEIILILKRRKGTILLLRNIPDGVCISELESNTQNCDLYCFTDVYTSSPAFLHNWHECSLKLFVLPDVSYVIRVQGECKKLFLSWIGILVIGTGVKLGLAPCKLDGIHFAVELLVRRSVDAQVKKLIFLLFIILAWNCHKIVEWQSCCLQQQ